MSTLVAIVYVLGIFPAAVLIGRWADDDGFVDPYYFGTLAGLFWPLVAFAALIGWVFSTLAKSVESVARRWP